MSLRLFTFSYSVTRDYPYVWFKWVVFVGGILASALFTALSLASSGYAIHVQQTSNYNATKDQKIWTQSWPFSLVAQTTSCLSNQLPVNSKFWTNKYGLPWIVTKVWTHGDDEVPILTYTKNPLENCSIGYLQVNLEPMEIVGTELRLPLGQVNPYQGHGNLRWNPRVTAIVNCTINNGVVPTVVTLSTDYSHVLRADTMGSFPKSLQANRTSLYWGKSLLTWYWSKLSCVGWDSQYYIRAYGLLPRTDNASIDITSERFFNVPHFWLLSKAGTQAATWSHDNLYQIEGTVWAKEDTLDVRKEVDWLAKAMYAVVLADLGQSSGHPRDNGLGDPQLLAKLSSRIPEIRNQATRESKDGFYCLVTDGPAQKAYEPGVDLLLNITPSYIATSYQCNVPELKPTGSLILSVLIADFVLLSAAWKLLSWGTQFWHARRDPNANRCEGCLVDTGRSLYSPQPSQHLITPSLLINKTGYLPLGEDESEFNLRSRRHRPVFDDTRPIALRELLPKTS